MSTEETARIRRELLSAVSVLFRDFSPSLQSLAYGVKSSTRDEAEDLLTSIPTAQGTIDDVVFRMNVHHDLEHFFRRTASRRHSAGYRERERVTCG